MNKDFIIIIIIIIIINWSARHWQWPYFAITEFKNCFNIRSPSLFLTNIFGKQSSLPFFRQEEKSMVSFTHEQSIICSQTQLDDIAHGQTIICGQLFAGHVVSVQPMKRKENLHWMIIVVNSIKHSLKTYLPTFALIIALIIHELL